MKKVAVLVEDHYQVLEVWYPYLRLREEGMQTVLVGTGKGEYKSKEGYPAKVELSIKKAKEPYEHEEFLVETKIKPENKATKYR